MQHRYIGQTGSVLLVVRVVGVSYGVEWIVSRIDDVCTMST